MTEAGSRGGLVRALKVIYFLAVAALIVAMRPTLPYNTILFDYSNAAGIVCIGIGALFTRRLRVRLLVPISLILLGSLVAMLNSGSLSANVVALAQEIYLIGFFLALYNVIETREEMRALVILYMAAASTEGLIILTGLTVDLSTRAVGTFENPNMAASYAGMSVFLVTHPVMARRRLLKAAYLLLTCGGLIATKSLSALMALVLSALAIFGADILQARGRRVLRTILFVIAVTGLAAFVLPGLLGVHNYLDRLPGSVSGRLTLWQIGMETFLENPLGTTIGPAGFVESGFVSGGHWGVGRQLSLHSDYLSFLVERGVIGFAGLLALLGSIGAMLAGARGDARSREERAWILGLCAIFLFVLIDAFGHEVMHYRHVWLALGLIVSQCRLEQRGDGGTVGSV